MVEWWCPQGGVGAQAWNAGTQVTVFDEILDDEIAEPFDAGAIVNLRVWIRLHLAAAPAAVNMFQYVMMILPRALAVPSVITEGAMKANELFCWMQGTFDVVPTTTDYKLEIATHTLRNFARSGRLCIVVVNKSAANLNVESNYLVDAYLNVG